MSACRLPAPAGLWLERERPVAFRFNGRQLSGLRGDTLASALLANGIGLVGRSFKLHRPRGVYSCGIEEPCAVVDVGEGARHTANVRATLLPLEENLSARSVNCWPGVRFDVGAATGWLAPLLPAGFYYKTFKWPGWRWFEPAIRRMAGLGSAPTEPDGDRYEELAATTEVLVAGGGIAGLSAAVAAARAGAATLLVAGGGRLGGALGWRGDAEVAALEATARSLGVRILTRTLAFGVYDHNLVCACETVSGEGAVAGTRPVLRERLWKIRARAVIAAAGAIERPLVFPDNDRPGVMLAGAAVKYAQAFGVACGERAVLVTESDSAYAAAAALRAAGVHVVALVDRRSSPRPAAGEPGVRVLADADIVAVAGARAVRGCAVAPGVAGFRRRQRLECDLILSSAGHAPAVQLHSQAGGRL
ncbi:MAG TPA: 2Fe-2S iron-sulfur cluster-binding protein, partial [Steroidobacteraceae bacterium]|nr:2Fe-2S iron-sulfur cluster-binding protein [Steroidobacteraceae bacterium]